MSRPMADTPKRRARAGSSMTTSRPRRSGWCSTRARACRSVARDLDLTESALRDLGRAGPAPIARRARTGPDDGGARGTGAAAQRESRAADGARNPKKSRGLLREAPAVKFAWIAAEKAGFRVSDVVSRARRDAAAASMRGRVGPSRRTRARDRQLTVLVRTSFEASKRRYGSPRIHEDLAGAGRAREPQARRSGSCRRTELQARQRKRFKCTTMSDHDQPIAANLLDRQFTAAAPESALGRRHDRVRDRRERQAVSRGDPRSVLAVHRGLGGQCGQRPASDDPALEMALKRRCPDAGLLHHSDQGCTYASEDYQTTPRHARHHLQHEPTRRLLRQRGDGELLLHGEERARRSLRQLR